MNKSFREQAVPATLPWDNSVGLDKWGAKMMSDAYTNNVNPEQDALRRNKNKRCARCPHSDAFLGGCRLKRCGEKYAKNA